ncbi:helix-turn-helix transcriptional regulator [Cereibacter azotoformans]|uniref:CP4-57 regulatory protein AlpA n=1 Tax=Cereibacter azotoformans TaxID=43057 RepID=A0A2T5JLH6_9RHOB|nr:AlpA family phage regulatory protein [Cereibacter azotoformans]PTR07768.1 CP4-57 regulatory protein AlpA [Cereibacter azotoformans]
MERKLIPSATVRQLCGGISDMSLWRWLNNPALSFPKPVVISRRRYWREAEVMAWLDARAEEREVA